MKKNLLWGILAVIVILIVSVSIFRSVKAEKKSEENVTDMSQVKNIRNYQHRGQLDEAIREANIYLESNPDNTELFIVLAECYASKGDLALARETIKKALVINGKHPWALRVSAAIYRQQFEIQKDDDQKKKYLDLAQVEIEKSLDIEPNHWSNVEAAQLYFYQNNKPKAIEAIEAALKVEPQNDYIQAIKAKIQSMP